MNGIFDWRFSIGDWRQLWCATTLSSGERTRLACSVWRPRRTHIRRFLRPTILIATVFALIWLCLPKPPLLDGIPFSQCVRDRSGALLDVTLTPDQKFRIWTPLAEISPDLIQATLHYEDKYYARHPGVNPVALVRSLRSALRPTGRTGGSTITMQVARLRYHLYTRTFTGKLIQIVRALELERHYSKTEILEAYLNLAPYGRNIEGAGAASEIYFGKEPARITAPEAVVLSVIPQSPTRRALRIDRENSSVGLAQNRWYDRTPAADPASELSPRSFEARATEERKHLAPHFVQEVLQSVTASAGARPNKTGGNIITTLDLDKQRLVERRVTDYLTRNKNLGFENASVLLVDTRNMEVLSQVGSADFFNEKICGQIDGTRSRRSPGSTLKPLLYALAMEQGLIHPLSIVADSPHSFGDYNPENYDREFLGPIKAS